jgi:hypothetical protein
VALFVVTAITTFGTSSLSPEVTPLNTVVAINVSPSLNVLLPPNGADNFESALVTCGHQSQYNISTNNISIIMGINIQPNASTINGYILIIPPPVIAGAVMFAPLWAQANQHAKN